MTGALLEAVDLTTGYGSAQVLHGLSIILNRNETVGLFGPNGNGKTTLLRTLSGLMKPWAGDVIAFGRSAKGLSPLDLVEMGIIHVPQASPNFPAMTVRENLWLAAQPSRARKVWRRTLKEVMEMFPRLEEREHQLSRTLSGGERQMLAIGMGLMGLPKLLMLDEPTLGLSPRIKLGLKATIAEISARDIPLLIVDQDLEFLLETCDRLYFIEHGAAVKEFSTAEKIEGDEIMEMYFGRAL